MLVQDIRFNDDIYLVKPIVKVDRAVARTRENLEESENEDRYQIRESYADRGETKKGIALYYRLRNSLKSLCILSEVGLICREQDVPAIEELEKTFAEQVAANNFKHVKVFINICLIRVSNANSKVFQQVSEDLKEQLTRAENTLRDTQIQKTQVENNLKNVTHTVDGIKEAVRTIDIAKLARDGEFLEALMNFDMNEETKESIAQLKAATSGLIQEVKDWRSNVSRFDFLVVEDEEEAQDAPKEAE